MKTNYDELLHFILYDKQLTNQVNKILESKRDSIKFNQYLQIKS